MLLGNRYPWELIGPIAQGTPFDAIHPFTYMAALYNLIVVSSVAVLATLFHKKLKKIANKIKKNANHNIIMYGIISFIAAVIVFDIATALFTLSIIPLLPLLLITIFMSGLVALATTYYVKYDAKAQTLGLTIWSIHQAKEWFKGRKLNEREGENAIVNWKLVETDNDDVINFSKHDMNKMEAEVGDLVYISDRRKYLGGLKSCHTVYGEPHSENGIVFIRNLHIEKGLFVKGRILEAEKEM